jgi:hypothetical protein
MWQGASPWGSAPYGFGGKMIGQWGCTATALAEMLRMAGRPLATPQTVCEAAEKAIPPVWAPGASAAVLPRLARAQGLRCADSATYLIGAKRGGADGAELGLTAMSTLITESIVRGKGWAWLHVGRLGQGRHWLAGFAFDELRIYATDSETAKVETIDRRTLEGRRWSVVRVRAVGV